MRKIIIIGAGLNGIKALREFGHENVQCFADNSESRQGTLLEGKEIIPVEELRSIYRDYVLLISPSKYDELIHQIREMGCEEYIVYSDLRLSCVNSKDILLTSLYTPTMIKKCGEKYFIVDCWHHRILYSSTLDFSIERWNVFDDGLQNPHSIDFDGTHYVVDNTDRDEIIVYKETENGFESVNTLHISGRPHKVIYSAKMKKFLVLLSMIPAIAIVEVNGREAKLHKVIEWDVPNIYCRSIKIIDNNLFLISSCGKIFRLDYENGTLGIIGSYTMLPYIYGMVDMEFWEGKWLISSYTNENGDIAPKIVCADSLENFTSGKFREVALMINGAPYFFEKIDSGLYGTIIDKESGIFRIFKGFEDLNGEVLYKKTSIDGEDLLIKSEYPNERKKVGGVELNYRYYFGEDKYSDGKIEDVILSACKNNSIDKLIAEGTEWSIFYHFSELRKNLLSWMKSNKNATVLEIGAGMGAVTQVLSEKFGNVECIELSEKRSIVNAYRNKDCDNVKIMIGNFQDIEFQLGTYDYITLIGVLEYAALYFSSDNPYLRMLELVKKHLKPGGQLILAIENRLGLKYFNGVSEDHTCVPYEGLNDYGNNRYIRTFSKKELEQLIKAAGFGSMNFYYPYPDYKLPTEIFSDGYLPKAGDLRSNNDNWAEPQIVNFETDTVWDLICEEGLFPEFSNSFLLFANEKKESSVLYAKYNPKRNARFATNTMIIRENNTVFVEKEAVNPLAGNHICNIPENENRWNKSIPLVNCVQGYCENMKYIGSFLVGERVDNILYRMRYSKNQLLAKLKEIVTDYLIPENGLIDFYMTKSFEALFGQYSIAGEKSSIVTNVDVSFCNMIKVFPERYQYIDCEWIVDFPVPYQYPAWRAVRRFYYQYYGSLKNVIDLPECWSSLGVNAKKQELFEEMEMHFMNATSDINRLNLWKRYSRPVWNFSR